MGDYRVLYEIADAVRIVRVYRVRGTAATLIAESGRPAMSIAVENELATTGEATAILLEKMPASKVARLLAALQVGTGDYVKTRDRLFAGETVDSLFEQAKAAE